MNSQKIENEIREIREYTEMLRKSQKAGTMEYNFMEYLSAYLEEQKMTGLCTMHLYLGEDTGSYFSEEIMRSARQQLSRFRALDSAAAKAG